MHNFVLSTVLINAALLVTSTKTSIEGYYWRDYEGLIPDDALEGGMDQIGRPIYIGQALHESKLIPGKIYGNGSNIYFQWAGEQSTNKNVKIFCTQHPEKFEWILTKPDKVMQLTNKLLVKGGHEENYFTYIGRVNAGGETTVGKVICRITDCLGLYFTKDGQGIEHREAFEILSYNPNPNSTDVNLYGSSISLIITPQ